MNLRELIAAHKGQRTYAELERASGLSTGWWFTLATVDLQRRPPEATLDAIARGLGIDRAEVDEAVKTLPIVAD